ncbi:MAG: hypothetical protein V4632_20200 [Pseudomonadota bacterium]
MLSYFYKRFERTSMQQLREDFGEFPPAPLQCTPPASTFVVVRVRGPGAWINYWRRSAELLQALESNPETVATELLEALSDLSRVDAQTDPESGQARIAHRYVVPRSFVRAALMGIFRRVDTRSKRLLGHVLPITQHDRQITLLDRASTKAERAAAVLAHEHLHFLQHQNAVTWDKAVREPQQILGKKLAQDRFILYLLERLEVEARLHELVLSHYRAWHMLPQTVDAFLGMLADWEEIGEYLVQITAHAGLKMQGTGLSFTPRSVEFGGQLGDLLSRLKDANSTTRFVCEVLPVMYGNLLHYYGDAQASAGFLAQIPRPNLYDRLYTSAGLAPAVSRAPPGGYSHLVT